VRPAPWPSFWWPCRLRFRYFGAAQRLKFRWSRWFRETSWSSRRAAAAFRATAGLSKSRDLFVDEATLTGETYPAEKSSEPVPADTAAGQKNQRLVHGHPRRQRKRQGRGRFDRAGRPNSGRYQTTLDSARRKRNLSGASGSSDSCS